MENPNNMPSPIDECSRMTALLADVLHSDEIALPNLTKEELADVQITDNCDLTDIINEIGPCKLRKIFRSLLETFNKDKPLAQSLLQKYSVSPQFFLSLSGLIALSDEGSFIEKFMAEIQTITLRSLLKSNIGDEPENSLEGDTEYFYTLKSIDKDDCLQILSKLPISRDSRLKIQGCLEQNNFAGFERVLEETGASNADLQTNYNLALLWSAISFVKKRNILNLDEIEFEGLVQYCNDVKNNFSLPDEYNKITDDVLHSLSQVFNNEDKVSFREYLESFNLDTLIASWWEILVKLCWHNKYRYIASFTEAEEVDALIKNSELLNDVARRVTYDNLGEVLAKILEPYEEFFNTFIYVAQNPKGVKDEPKEIPAECAAKEPERSSFEKSPIKEFINVDDGEGYLKSLHEEIEKLRNGKERMLHIQSACDANKLKSVSGSKEDWEKFNNEFPGMFGKYGNWNKYMNINYKRY